MNDVVIHSEGLGKKYTIAHHASEERYVALRDVLARGAKRLRGKANDFVSGRGLLGASTVDEFWALKDVTFEVKRGEVLGIIGRNGAGKSTLLKILSRITEPSVGRVSIRGRIASLLEVGTGFHSELTGRENIYLNGAILGMTRAEIRRKFDEIVAFADVDRFLDTPVKRYSSGMYVRLAFAVAAHLEPEILIVDEVLAVGDAEFQKKCLGKMSEVAGGGRTVLFVSHQLGMVARLCSRAMLLSGGQTVTIGDTRDALDAYRRELEVFSGLSHRDVNRTGPHITKVVTLDSSGELTSEFFFDEEVVVRVTIQGEMSDPGTLLTTTLVSRDGNYVSTSVTRLSDLAVRKSKAASISITFPKNIIAPNDYYFRVALFVPPSVVFDLHELVAPIKVRDSGSAMAAFEGISYGHVILPCRVAIAE